MSVWIGAETRESAAFLAQRGSNRVVQDLPLQKQRAGCTRRTPPRAAVCAIGGRLPGIRSATITS